MPFIMIGQVRYKDGYGSFVPKRRQYEYIYINADTQACQ